MNNSNRKNIDLVKRALAAFRSNPPDLREIGDQQGEIRYVESTTVSYERTVADILQLYSHQSSLKNLNIIELGAFLGIVSKALSLDSASVIACDIPEFFDRANVKQYYQLMNLEIASFNLRNYKMPFPTSSQDCVIACETFEHLNFNPLPIFAEINRILKPGGIFYIAMPNGSYLLKRLRYLFTGNTPGFSVKELFSQLDPHDNMVVGLHWKEYSMSQTVEMVSPIGFEVVSARTTNDTGSGHRSKFRRFIQFMTPGGDTQVVVFKKASEFTGNLFVCADS